MARANSQPVDRYLEQLWDQKASDLILTAGSPPRFRVDGELVAFETEALSPEAVESILDGVLSEDMARRLRESREVDFSFNWRSTARFRANAFFQRGSMGLAVRVLPYAIPSFAALGLPAVTERLVRMPHGLVLVTGPTGSGKSTTLASMLDFINEHRACHILTLEDPIEYIHHHKMSLVNQREVGEDTLSFTSGLRAALREDPDVLLIGEMRDLETIRIALTIAETGHLVFATLHTNDTAQALDRIVDVFPAEQQAQIKIQLANSLQAIYHQQLLPRIGGGRVAAFEVLLANHAVRNLIKEGKSSQIRNVVMTNLREGMQTLEASLSELVANGVIDHDVARLRSVHPGEVRQGWEAEAPAAAQNGRVQRPR
jgi:twitching motility protein PilT